RSELSDDGQTWLIPAGRYKSKRNVLLPLSRRAQHIVADQPILPGGDHVFSATGRLAMGGHDDRKKKFDQVCGVENYTVHDLRRTARTLLSRCGVRPDIAERVLGHSVGGHLGAVYDQHRYVEEMRAGVEALAALIERIVRPPEAAVADMVSERRR